MRDYISREAALSAQNKSMNLSECRKRLERIPAADVVPVVRCKDCLHEDCAMYHSLNWFCADGERREGNDAPHDA